MHVAGVQRFCVNPHLVSGVVDVVLTCHVCPGGIEQIGQSAAYNGPPGVADVKRAGRVDTDELDLDLLAGLRVRVPELFSGCADRLDLVLEPPVGQGDVDKSRACHLYFLDNSTGRERLDDRGCYGRWRHLHRARQPERQVGRKIPVALVSGLLYGDFRRAGCREHSPGLGCGKGLGNGFAKLSGYSH